MKNQIWDIKDNLMLKTDGSVLAVYRIPSKVINSTDAAAKEEFKKMVYAALNNLRSYHDFEIQMLPVDVDLVENFKKLSQDIDWDSGAGSLAEYVLNGTIEKLEQSIGTLYEYQYYLIVPLKSIHVSVDLKSVVKQGYDNARKTILSTLGIGEVVPKDWEKGYRNQREVLENTLSLLDIRSLTTRETIFLNRLQYLRGQFYDKNTEISLVQNSMDNLDEVNLEFEHVNVLKLTNFNQSSYVAFLPVNHVPENMSYLHLQEELQNLRFPVEGNFKVQFSLPKGVFSLTEKAKRARKRLKNTSQEAAETDDVQKSSVLKSIFLLEDLRRKVDEEEALVSYLNTLIITDQTMEGLKNKYEALYAYLNQIGVEVVRANADQLYLFYKTRIGEVLEREDKNFLQAMTLEAFCENLFFMTKKVGTDIGLYIGRVDHQNGSWQGDYKAAIGSSSNAIFTNLLQANKLNVKDKTTSNPHVAIIGETGSGKSYLTKLLFTYHTLLKTKTLYIDPKAEMRRQYQAVLKEYEEKGIYPEIQEYIQSIDFVTLDANDPKNYGVLDPLVFLKGREARDLADSMIDTLLGKENTLKIRTAYLKLLDKYLALREDGQKVGMIQVFEDLKKHENETIRDAGEFLISAVEQSILSLCFSDGKNEGIDTDAKITILEITGLNLPNEASSNLELTQDERKSLSVMYALGYFCTKFGKQNPHQETIEFFDEAWFFNSTSVGKKILKMMKRVGRSENNFLVFITQSVNDIQSEDDTTGFGTVFAFLEKNEIEDVLKYLKIPVTKSTREWIGNMTMGQCIYYDTFGRKERITVDGLFPEITKLFDTVKSDLKAVS